MKGGLFAIMNDTLLFFISRSTSVYLPFSFYKYKKNKQVYSAESWPSLSVQSRPPRGWSPKKSLASYRKGNWANSTYISQCLGNVPLFTFRTRKSINRLVFTAAKHESKVHSLTWRKFDELLLLAATQYIYATIIAMQFIAKWKSFCFLYIACFFFCWTEQQQHQQHQRRRSSVQLKLVPFPPPRRPTWCLGCPFRQRKERTAEKSCAGLLN